MDQIVWNQSLNVGVAEIDKQGQQRVAMVNQLLALEGVTVDSETVSNTLTRMTE